MSVCVVGAGIIGLSTACILQEAEPRAQITLIAEKFSPDVTSDIAAGIIRPYADADPRKELMIKWVANTYERVEKMALSTPEFGATVISGYDLDVAPVDPKVVWRDCLKGYRHVPKRELQDLGFYDFFQHGVFYTTFSLESSRYLPPLLKQFQQYGGKVRRQKLSSLQDLNEKYDVIVNCSGLGAGQLVNDELMRPVRGQIVRLDAPHIKHFYMFGDDHYVIPNSNTVVAGGTHQYDDWSTTIRAEDTNQVLSANFKYLPALKKSKIVKEVCGLRPGRSSVRLEREHLMIGEKATPVVHNYGHSGAGVSLHWGCAMDAAALAADSIHKPTSKI
uniref:FAD dependent oxidoreductase domain-containing protein n=1 Tax=Plectus sambesii TaxID=2011161 RepID=A0A914XCA6_9BILA